LDGTLPDVFNDNSERVEADRFSRPCVVDAFEVYGVLPL
jgi:hypothetical protein